MTWSATMLLYNSQDQIQGGKAIMQEVGCGPNLDFNSEGGGAEAPPHQGFLSPNIYLDSHMPQREIFCVCICVCRGGGGYIVKLRHVTMEIRPVITGDIELSPSKCHEIFILLQVPPLLKASHMTKIWGFPTPTYTSILVSRNHDDNKRAQTSQE
jgi:hypothetical protein